MWPGDIIKVKSHTPRWRLDALGILSKPVVEGCLNVPKRLSEVLINRIQIKLPRQPLKLFLREVLWIEETMELNLWVGHRVTALGKPGTIRFSSFLVRFRSTISFHATMASAP